MTALGDSEDAVIKHFQTLGCTDEMKSSIASLVYSDLKEVKVTNLEYLYDKDLDLLYFRGERKDFDAEIIVPTSSCEEIDMLKFEEIQRKLAGDLKCVTMAICNPSSTIIYYSIRSDFYEK